LQIPDIARLSAFSASLVAAAALSAQAPQPTAQPAPFALKDGDRVVFYGDSITQEGGYGRFVEEYVRTRFPRWDVRFYNAGVGGDTVRGGWAGPIELRLERDVVALAPSVVTVMLGMNDGGYKAFDPQTLARFGEGYLAIAARLRASLPGVRLTFIPTSPFDDVSRPPQFAPGYDDALRRLGCYVTELGAREKAAVVGFREPMNGGLAAVLKGNPDLARQLIPDRVHPGPAGHVVMGAALLRGWNAPSLVTRVEIDAARLRVVAAENTDVSAFEATEGRLSWTQLDRALPLPLGFEDGEIELAQRAGADLESLDQQPLVVAGLRAGRFELRIDGQSIGTLTDAELAKGVNLARYNTPMRWQAYRVRWSVGDSHEVQRVRRRLLVAAEKDPSLRATAEALAKQDETAQDERRALATPQPRKYELRPVAGSAPAAEAPRTSGYRNPIIPGFHPDPSIVRVGEDYYLVTSSFEFFPGVPVFHSRDLVHWRQIGHALTRPEQLPLEKARVSGGIYAPTIRYHDGTFYMITTNVDGGGNFFVTAKDPAGPWSDPVWLPEFGGIDPSLFFDDDGIVYLTGPGGGGERTRGIYQSSLDVKTGKLLAPPRLIWDRTGARYPEGPHLYKIRGWYYLLIAEGGTEYGHVVTIARSRSPWGPFEACSRNPILTHRQTEMDQPVQGTGHADLVEDHRGNWWMVFLAFRPVGGWYWHHLGRETFLAPLTWDAQGWPVVNDGKPVGLEARATVLPNHPLPSPPVRTEFEGPLGAEWNYLRNPVRESYALDTRSGWLTLQGQAIGLDEAKSPTWIGRRQQHLRCRATALLDFVPGRDGEEAGLTVYRNPEHHYEISVGRRDGRRTVFVRQRVGPRLETVTESAAVDESNPIVLQIEATPEEYSFSFGAAAAGATKPGQMKRLDTAPTRFLSTEVAGGFTGAFFALYSTGNGQPSSAPAHVDWFDYEPLEP
jgi:xylan 1,4-beta-xylosidase